MTFTFSTAMTSFFTKFKWGTAGDDYFVGRPDTEVFNGGSGSDTITYFNSPVGVNVSLYSNTAFNGDAAGDRFYGIENLFGSMWDDLLIGDDHANELSGLGGNDSLFGYGGDDLLDGGTGDDKLWGGDCIDKLYGGYGNDRLYGGAGSDSLYGGAGADTFAYMNMADCHPSFCGELIWDFNRAEGDRIDLAGIDANVHEAGDQVFKFIGTAEFSGAAREVRILWQDDWGTGIGIFDGENYGLIVLAGAHTPDASWFVL
jgi:Ca2+-binding RTX toxin-like protein